MSASEVACPRAAELQINREREKEIDLQGGEKTLILYSLCTHAQYRYSDTSAKESPGESITETEQQKGEENRVVVMQLKNAYFNIINPKYSPKTL